MRSGDPLFTWSDQAVSDLDAVCEDLDHMAGARDKLAAMLHRGWGGNRDKPAWALMTMASRLAQTGPCGLYDVLANEPRDIGDALDGLAGVEVERGRDGTPLRWSIASRAGTVHLDRRSIALLQRYGRFLILSDDAAQADPVRGLFDAVIAAPGDDAAVGEAARAVGRMMHAYRVKHFDDGHAGGVFSVLRAHLGGTGHVEIDDRTILDFWSGEGSGTFRTYRAAFFAFRDFAEALQTARARAGARQAGEEAVLAWREEASVPFDDPFADDDEKAANDNGPMVVDEGEAVAFDRLRSGPVTFLTKAELALVETFGEAGSFGRRLPLSLLRLLSFATIQSAIANDMRFGRDDVTLDERVSCAAAAPYDTHRAAAEAVTGRLRDWLAMALALTSPADKPGEAAQAVRDHGAALLKASRVKAIKENGDALPAIFAEAQAELLAAAFLLGEVNRAFAANASLFAGDRFEADRTIFARVLARLYLAGATNDERMER